MASGTRPDPDAVAARCHRAVVAGAERGSDSFGVVAVDRDGRCRAWRDGPPPRYEDVRALVDDRTACVLAVSRATPTTEWREGQPLGDVQPFTSPHWVVAHNGTVANDRELRAGLAAMPSSNVDSAVLPHLFEERGFARGLDAIAGSFALAAVDRRQPHRLRLARNFKPLVLSRPLPGMTMFASVAGQLAEPGADPLGLDAAAVVEPPPYSRLDVGADGAIAVAALEPPPPRRRALVVASGGLDSTVAAAMMTRRCDDVTLLHFAYGCRAEPRERRAVHDVARQLGCDVRTVPLDWLRAIGGSTLTAGGDIAPGEVGAEYPHEWVPARNMVMLAAACAVADADGYTDIATGTNLEEGGAYPDNTQAFLATMDAASQIGTLQRPRISAPLGNLVKHEIVRAGLELDAPLGSTWSCYRAGERHCGRCGPCFMRRVAFEMNGSQDPAPFAAPLERLRPV